MSSALSNRQIAHAALIVVFGFVTSGLLGLIRTAVISARFGTSNNLDAFYVAQRIPETIFVLVAGGALGSAFIPVFSRFLAANDRENAWRLASATLTLVALLSVVLALLGGLFAPWLVPAVLAPGKPSEVQTLIVSLTQIMLLTTIVFSISGLMMGILNAHQIFWLPALAPAMYNIGLIIGALAGDTIYGLAWGAVLGASLHLVVQLPGLLRIGRPRFLPNWRVPGVREVTLLMAPRLLGLAVVQINFTVNTAFSSTMVEGSYTALTTAWFLLFFALGIIGQSIGAAVFPSLSALAAEGNIEEFKNRLSNAMRGVLFLAFPATIGLIVLGSPIISLVFERNQWTPASTAGTAWALAFFAIGIAGHSLLEVLSRAFYSLSDTRTPVVIGVISMLSNIVLSVIFIRVIGDPASLSRGAFGGLALANSLTTLWEALALWWLLRRRIGSIHDRHIMDGAWRAIVAALVMGGVLLLARNTLKDSGAFLMTIVGVALGAGAFFVFSAALGINEARTVPRMILQRVRR
jgi:putative peptidoglycan lipid II flippase